jgi:UDPglucose 6-dehydrogenase/GDP-mannose 6-dehydrogenase
MTKYASNALFATLISYSNEIARICEATKDVDVVDVWRGVHLDHRLTPSQSKIVIKNNRVVPGFVNYLFSGCGYGGSCFPKDTKALDAYALELGLEPGIISKVIAINNSQPLRVVELVKSGLKKVKDSRIAILGLTFKENTDDMREAPSLPIISELIKLGGNIVCHDPVISVRKSSAVTDMGAVLVDSALEAVKGSDAVIILAGWAEYKKLKSSFFKKNMKRPLLIDGRRIFGNDMLKSGIDYRGIGYNKK